MDIKAIEEAIIWIQNNDCHKQGVYEYTCKYMNDKTVVYKLPNRSTFRDIVISLGYEQYTDICENEWYEKPRS